MRFIDLKNWMLGEDCVVVGCGPSANPVSPPAPYHLHWTLGSNRSVGFCDPDFAVSVEPIRSGIWAEIKPRAPLVNFCQHGKGMPRTVQFELDAAKWLPVPQRAPTCPRSLRLGQSTFWGIALALYLGFERVGVVGLDLTPDRYAPHQLIEPEEAYDRLLETADQMGRRIFNLNPESHLQALPSGEWDEVRPKNHAPLVTA